MKYYQKILSITNDLSQLRNIIFWLRSRDLLDDDTEKYFYSCGALTNTLFKKIERCIAEAPHKMVVGTDIPEAINAIVEAIKYDKISTDGLQEAISNKLGLKLDLSFNEKIEKLKLSTTKKIF